MQYHENRTFLFCLSICLDIPIFSSFFLFRSDSSMLFVWYGRSTSEGKWKTTAEFVRVRV